MTPIAIAAYERLAKGRKAGDPLCRKEDGQAMEQMRYWFDPCVGAAGLVNYHWHDCRHTFCSRLVMAGVPLAAVAEFAGHRSITMTMRYAHLQPMNHSQAVNAMMSFYKSETGEPTATKTATGTPTGFQQEAISL
jgi:integrase